MLRHGARLTTPSLRDSILAFFIGNLFANFVFLFIALIFLARAFHLEFILAAVLALYGWHIFSSRAQYTG